MNMLTWTEILKLYEKLIRKFGGTYGIRDENLLKSAIDTAYQTFDGKEPYPSITEKIATICYSIIKNHPMVDGNKRLGTAILLVLCKLNGLSVECTDEELVDLGTGIAEGRYKKEDVLAWL